MKKIKILHINLSSGFAGAERHMIDLVNYQSKDSDTFIVKLKNNNFINYSIVKKKQKFIKFQNFSKKIF